jgi:hypothetical protein
MEPEENEIHVPLYDDQKYLRTLAVIVIGVAGLPLMGGAVVLAAADPLPPGVPWLEHNQSAALLLGLGLLMDTAGALLIIQSISPAKSARLARRIRRVIGGEADDRMMPPP